MAPDLLLHPIFDVAEALAGVSNREVVHPPPEHRIDQAYYPVNRLRPVSAKHPFEPAHQRRPLFELGRVMRPHRSAHTAKSAEVKSQKPEAITSFQVDYTALFIIDFNLQGGSGAGYRFDFDLVLRANEPAYDQRARGLAVAHDLGANSAQLTDVRQIWQNGL